MRQFLLSVWGAAGDTSIQQANEKRFQERVQQLFKQFKEQRLTNAALECEQLINRGTQQLTEVCNHQSYVPAAQNQQPQNNREEYTSSCCFIYTSGTKSAALQQKYVKTALLLAVSCVLSCHSQSIKMAPDNHVPFAVCC